MSRRGQDLQTTRSDVYTNELPIRSVASRDRNPRSYTSVAPEAETEAIQTPRSRPERTRVERFDQYDPADGDGDGRFTHSSRVNATSTIADRREEVSVPRTMISDRSVGIQGDYITRVRSTSDRNVSSRRGDDVRNKQADNFLVRAVGGTAVPNTPQSRTPTARYNKDADEEPRIKRPGAQETILLLLVPSGDKQKFKDCFALLKSGARAPQVIYDNIDQPLYIKGILDGQEVIMPFPGRESTVRRSLDPST